MPKELKVTIADILYAAADKHLTSDSGDDWYGEIYSCNAIKYAAQELTGEDHPYCVDAQALARYPKYAALYPYQHKALKFVKELGVKVGSSKLFDNVPYEVQQGYRHSWLYTAAMIAEEEGL